MACWPLGRSLSHNVPILTLKQGLPKETLPLSYRSNVSEDGGPYLGLGLDRGGHLAQLQGPVMSNHPIHDRQSQRRVSDDPFIALGGF